MLTPENRRHRPSGIAAAVIMAATLLVPAGPAVAMDATTVEPVEVDLTPAAASLEELRSMVDDLSLANEALTADNSSLRQTVDTLSRERDDLRRSLSRFDDLYRPLEADRQLLFELRKALPETRPEAEAQIARMRSLALAADPSRLGQLVDRLDATAPAFLDWRFGGLTDPQELSSAYVDSGANAFDSSMEEFRSEVLMSVANRLDGLLTILDRVR